MPLWTFLFSFTLLVLPVGFAYGAIIPECPLSGCRLCDMVTLGNNLISFVIQMSVIVAVLSIVIVGFKSVVSGESGAGELQGTLASIAMGIVIMLSGWLVVDTLLKMLVADEYKLGPWNKIECINNPEMTAPIPRTITNGPGGAVIVTGGGKGTGAQCATANTACSPEALRAAGMTEAQANTMSCIAMTESTGNPNARNSVGTACGTFQVLQKSWKGTGGCSSHSACTDASCNALAAKALMDGRAKGKGSIYGDWTCPGCNSKAQGCIDTYDPGR